MIKYIKFIKRIKCIVKLLKLLGSQSSKIALLCCFRISLGSWMSSAIDVSTGWWPNMLTSSCGSCSAGLCDSCSGNKCNRKHFFTLVFFFSCFCSSVKFCMYFYLCFRFWQNPDDCACWSREIRTRHFNMHRAEANVGWRNCLGWKNCVGLKNFVGRRNPVGRRHQQNWRNERGTEKVGGWRNSGVRRNQQNWSHGTWRD